MGHRFIGNYHLDIAHLERFHQLIKESDRKTLQEALTKVKKTRDQINPFDLIKQLKYVEMPDEGLSIEEVITYCQKNPKLDWFINKKWKCHCCKKTHKGLQYLLKRGKEKGAVPKIEYKWDIHRRTSNVGKLQCARTVSDILGLPNRYRSVTNTLAPALIQANLEQTGKTGIVFGIENYKEGDVIIWRGSQKGPHTKLPGGKFRNYGHNRFSHTGIVRHVMEIEGEKYLAVQHDSSKLFIDLVPISKKPHNLAKVKKAVRTRKFEELAQGSSSPDKLRAQFTDIFTYRPRSVGSLVRVRFYKDCDKTGTGNFAFAIRTAHLQKTPQSPSPIS